MSTPIKYVDGNMPRFTFVTVGASDGEDRSTLINIDKIRCMYIYKSSQQTIIEFDKDHILRGVKETPEQILRGIGNVAEPAFPD